MDIVRRMRPLLGTFVEAGARGPGADAAINAAFAATEQAQQLWSFQDSASELSRINAGGGVYVAASRPTLRLLALACALMRRTGGAFDITVGGQLVIDGVLPDHGGPAPLPRGQADDIELARGAVRLRRPVRLTLDGIAKGYAPACLPAGSMPGATCASMATWRCRCRGANRTGVSYSWDNCATRPSPLRWPPHSATPAFPPCWWRPRGPGCIPVCTRSWRGPHGGPTR